MGKYGQFDASAIFIDANAEAYGILYTGRYIIVRGYRHKNSADQIIHEFRTRYDRPVKTCTCLELLSIEHGDGFVSVEVPASKAKSNVKDGVKKYFNDNFLHLERRYSDGETRKKFR
ncbi:MAG TPA: hypothetical protein VI968_04530 [archaeon]|nr:hypothetical protein [archaeon]